MDIEELLPRYLAAVQPSPTVVRVTRLSWPKFLAFCQREGLKALENLNSDHLQTFHQCLLWEPGPTGQLYTSCSVTQFLCRVRQVLRWAHASGYLAQDLAAHIALSQHPKLKPGLLTWEELDRKSVV